MGFPIRKFTDQSLFAAPHDLSQRTTSFFASQRQGIHRILLRHLIALINRCPSAISKLQGSFENAGPDPKSLGDVLGPCARRILSNPKDPGTIFILKTSLLQTHPGAKRSSSLTTGCSAFAMTTGRAAFKRDETRCRPKPTGCISSLRCGLTRQSDVKISQST